MLKFTRLIIASIMAVFSIGVAQADELVLGQTNEHWGSPNTLYYTSASEGTLVFAITNTLSYDKTHTVYYGTDGNYPGSVGVSVPAGKTAELEVPMSAGNNNYWLSEGDWNNSYVVTLKGGGAAEPDGTEANPYILTAEGVACPKAATSPTAYTYYKYVAEAAGVVTISHEMTSSFMGGISVNGADFTYSPSGMFIVNANDVIVVRVASQTDASAKKIKAVWSALKNGQTRATATTLNSGSNTISAIDNSHAVIPEWYMLTIPGQKVATITFGNYLSAYVWDGDNKEVLNLDENMKWEFTNSNVGAKTIYFEVSGTTNKAVSASVAFTDASAGAKFTHLGDVAWSVQDNKLPAAASYITVTFPNAQGGQASTPVKLENVYIFDEEAGGAPLNMDGTTEFSGNLGNGVNIYYNFELNHEYRVSLGNATVNGTYQIPSANEYFIGNGNITFYVGEKQQVDAETINLTGATMNDVAAGPTAKVYPLSSYVTITVAKAGLTKIADASKISLVLKNDTYPSGWTASLNPMVTEVNGNNISIFLGSSVADMAYYEADYTLTFAEGALSDNSGNIISGAAEYQWTCGNSSPTPTYNAPSVVSATNNGIANGTSVKTLSNTFVITFDEDIAAGFNCNPALYYNDNCFWDAVYNVDIDGKVATITFTNGVDLTKAGAYKLAIRYGFVANAHDSEKVFNGAELTWTVSASGEDPKPELKDFDLTVTNGQGDDAIAAGAEVGQLSWYFYTQVPEGAQPDMDIQATLTKDGTLFSTARGGMMDATTAYFTFRNAAPDFIAESGVYELTIPAGTFKVGDYKNNEFKASWTVKAPEVAKFDLTSVLNGNYEGAAPGEVSTLNNQFTINLGEKAYASTGSGNITLTKDGNPYGGNATMIAYPGMTEIYARFTFGSANETYDAGTYVLTIPEGYIVNADGEVNAAWTGTWTVIKTAHAIDSQVATPGAAQGLDELDKVFTLSGEDWDVIGEATPYMQISRNGDITTVDGVASVVDGIATITFPEKFTKGGTYTLMVPASTFFDNDGNYNGSCNSTWTVYGKADAFTGYQTLNISEAGFMDADQMANGVKVELPNADNGNYVNAELYNADGEKLSEGSFIINEQNVATFKFDNFLQAGNDYTLKLINVVEATGTVIETPDAVEIKFSILKPVITYKLGEVQWNNIAEGALTGAMADGVKISLIDGEGYDEKATVKVSATLNGEEKQFEGTPEGVVLFAGELTEGENTIVITSVEVFVDDNPVVAMPYGETIEKQFTASSTSGIAAIIAENGDAPMFNIAGQRIDVAKGIVIINGKKYQVK